MQIVKDIKSSEESNLPLQLFHLKETVLLKFKYFAYPDLSFGSRLKKIQENIDLLLEKDEDLKMNLERFEVLKYFDDSNIDLYNDTEFIENISVFSKIIKQNIGIYFNKQVNIQKEFRSVYESAPEYINTLLQVISNYKLDERVDDFVTLLTLLPNRHISSILQNKYIATKYQNTISKIILKNPKNAEILIRVFNLNSKFKGYFLPSTNYLSIKDINELLLQYVKSNSSNLNYLKQIYQGKFTIDIETRVRSLANDIYNKKTQQLFEEQGFSVASSLEVSIAELKNDLIKITASNVGSNYNEKIEINEKWLSETLDYNSILQNMIYVLELVDSSFKFNAIPNNESEGVFDRVFGLNDPNGYSINTVFKITESQYTTMFMTYIKYLNQNGINIVEVFKWYFEEYLKKEYGVLNFELEVLDVQLPIRVLNNDLHTQFQRIIKMYHLYSKYEEVNLNEVDIETNKRFDELKSINGTKYIYLDSDILTACAHHLFSDQSILGIIDKDNKFYASLEAKKVNYNTLEDYLLFYVDLLLENSLVKIDNGFLTVESDKYYILKNLFFKSNINYFWSSDDDKREIDNMIINKELRASDSLLSKQEVDYFNYYLNDYFSNGLALRNKYSHGSSGNFTEEEHQKNYILLCYLMTLFVIKINEEFNYKFDFNK